MYVPELNRLLYVARSTTPHHGGGAAAAQVYGAPNNTAVAAQPEPPAGQDSAQAARDTLLPVLTLDQLHDSLWQQLPTQDQRSLRLLSKAMRQQADDCRRSLKIRMPANVADRQQHVALVARLLHRFQRLSKLHIGSPQDASSQGEDVDLLLKTATATGGMGRLVRELVLQGVSKHLSQATHALAETCMRSSLTTLTLAECKLDGAVFGPLAACSALSAVVVARTAFESQDAVASLECLTQVRVRRAATA